MDLNYLKKILKLFDESSATELKIEEEGIAIKLSKSTKSYYDIAPHKIITPETMTMQTHINNEQKQPENTTEQTESSKEENILGHIIKSPIVGTFYRAPSPDSPPFVEIGDHITKGTTLCIIEAMKLMNEIESDINGTITKILIDNAQPVDYNQPLFVIKPD